ncbi:hypothetical protein OBBRIDRAFT_139279 [Obba rivulosa]|uniref:Uncharacterized protein n=1 Tax=Obba rivulosa TaxID=1052685 RepID=A0A8E2DM71_9APHY|nr:hypothetical protein OBBRIDRAFT_139279 [Obba rivulosa]
MVAANVHHQAQYSMSTGSRTSINGPSARPLQWNQPTHSQVHFYGAHEKGPTHGAWSAPTSEHQQGPPAPGPMVYNPSAPLHKSQNWTTPQMGHPGVQEDAMQIGLWSASERQYAQTAPGATVYFPAPPLPQWEDCTAPPAGYPGLRAEGLELQLIPPGPAPTTSSKAEPTLAPPSASQACGATKGGPVSSVEHYADVSTSWGYPWLKPTWDGETSSNEDVGPSQSKRSSNLDVGPYPSRKTGGMVKPSARKPGPRKRPGEACIPCSNSAKGCDGVRGSGVACS